ncbi:MAG: sulfatase modifying factor 1 [Polaribacter sp.]
MQIEDLPVTNVSWFSADAFCRAEGKRLPTVDEWEYVARSSKKHIDGNKEESYNQRILD